MFNSSHAGIIRVVLSADATTKMKDKNKFINMENRKDYIFFFGNIFFELFADFIGKLNFNKFYN